MELTNGFEVIFPKFGELDERCFPLDDFLTSNEGLQFDQNVIFNCHSFTDDLDLSLQGRDFLDELLSEGAGVTAHGRNLLGEGIELELKGAHLRLEFHILFGDFVLLGLDIGSQSLLRERNFGDGGVQLGNGFLHLAFGGLQGFEVGNSGGDFDGPLVDHHLKGKLEGVDFFDPDIEFGAPFVELFGHIGIDLDLTGFREAGDKEIEGFQGLLKSHSSLLCRLAEFSGEHGMNFLDPVGLECDLLSNELFEIPKIDLLGCSLAKGFDNDTHIK